MAPAVMGQASLGDSNKATSTKAHAFDREHHLPDMELCSVELSASGTERILLAGRHTCHNEAKAPKAQISTSYIIHSKTYYFVKFAEANSKAQYYLKHYDDFVALREALQEFVDETPWNESPISDLPQLPDTGRFGLRRSLSKIGVGSFGEKLQEELDSWLQRTLTQIPSLSAVPALEDFFGPDPLPASMSEANRRKLEDLHALLIRGASATEVATAAASHQKEDESGEGESATLLQSRRTQLRKQQTAGALAFENAGLAKVDGRMQAEEERSQRVSAPNNRRRQLRTQATAGATAFEMAGF